MLYNVFAFFSPHTCLDEEFDAPDVAADADLVQAIAAGRSGMHPEAWSNRSALAAVMPQGFHGYEWVPPVRYRRRPVEEPKPEPHRRKWTPLPSPEITYGGVMASGDMQLTCDDCGKRKFKSGIHHTGGRVPSDKQELLWDLAREAGWLIFGGRDLCPKCALATAVYACAILNRQTELIVER